MRKTLLMIACGLGLLVGTAHADVIAVPVPAVEPAMPTLPAKGSSKASVTTQFGQPQTQHPAAGGGSPRQPPITRWDYADFSVFFENGHVIDAVVKGRPAPIHHADELKPAE